MNGSDAIGWLGFIAILFSYFQVATRRWRVYSIPNQVGNVLGSGFLGFNSLVYQAWVPLVMNVVWGFTAVYYLFQILRNRE